MVMWPVPLVLLGVCIKDIDHAVPGVPKAIAAPARVPGSMSGVSVHRCVVDIVIL